MQYESRAVSLFALRARARATRDSRLAASPLAARRSKISLAHARYFRFVQHGLKSRSLTLAIFASFSTDFRAKERLLAVYVSLNSKKKLKQSQVDFYGHTLKEKGIQPVKEKLEAIHNIKAPSNIKNLQTILGIVTYLNSYS